MTSSRILCSKIERQHFSWNLKWEKVVDINRINRTKRKLNSYLRIHLSFRSISKSRNSKQSLYECSFKLRWIELWDKEFACRIYIDIVDETHREGKRGSVFDFARQKIEQKRWIFLCDFPRCPHFGALFSLLLRNLKKQPLLLFTFSLNFDSMFLCKNLTNIFVANWFQEIPFEIVERKTFYESFEAWTLNRMETVNNL